MDSDGIPWTKWPLDVLQTWLMSRCSTSGQYLNVIVLFCLYDIFEGDFNNMLKLILVLNVRFNFKRHSIVFSLWSYSLTQEMSYPSANCNTACALGKVAFSSLGAELSFLFFFIVFSGLRVFLLLWFCNLVWTTMWYPGTTYFIWKKYFDIFKCLMWR